MNYSGTAIARRLKPSRAIKEWPLCPPTLKLKVRKGHIKYKKIGLKWDSSVYLRI